MGKIQKIEPNYQSRFVQNKTKIAKNPSFGSNPPKIDIDKIADCFEKASDSKFIGLLKFLSRNTADYAEIQSQFINALFTATLAPYVIRHNPFSKKSKKDKEYAAERQPLSAGVAILGGVGLTGPINAYLDTVASEGNIEGYDKRVSPARSSLKDEFKRELNTAKDKKAFLEEIENFKFKTDDPKVKVEIKKIKESIEKIKPKDNKITLRYKNKCFDLYEMAVNEQRSSLYKALLFDDPNKITIKDGIIESDNIKLNSKAIPNLETKEKLTSFLNKKNFNNIKFKDFMKENFGISQHKDGTIKTYGLNARLKNIKAIDFLNSLGIEGFTEDNLRQALTELQSEKLECESVSKKMLTITGKQSSRISQLTIGENPTKAISLEQMFQRLGYIEDSGENTTKNLLKLMDQDVKSVVSELTNNKNLGNMKIKSLERNIPTILSDINPNEIAQNMLKTFKNQTKKAYDQFKFLTNIGANLVIVVITCSILNWIYPRYIEKFKPHLLKDENKTSNGGNK